MVSSNSSLQEKSIFSMNQSHHPGTLDSKAWMLLCNIFLFCAILQPSDLLADDIEGYLSAFSVAQGESINLHISTSASSYDVRVYDWVTRYTYRTEYDDLTGTEHESPDDAWGVGAQWPNPLQIDIPDSWPSGLYKIDLVTDNGVAALFFIVRENIPGSTSNILLLDNSPTSVAYNGWGGKALYDFKSADGVRASSVSLLRPGHHSTWQEQKKFVEWVDAMNIPIEAASLMDLHNDADLLTPYQTVAIVGQSEYWSKVMRDNLDNFLESGGQALILGGDTMFWQARFDGDNMICYKNPPTNDPMYGIDNSVVTTSFTSTTVNDPENRTLGVSFWSGGFVNCCNVLPASEGNGGFTVTASDHRFFSGTGLMDGDVFGQEHTIVGTSTDGAAFVWVDGQPVVTGTDGSPLDFEILAYAPAQRPPTPDGNGTMGYFEVGSNGGRVFNSATIDWADGLWSGDEIADPLVSKITLNVLAEFEPMSAANCAYAPNGTSIDSDEDGVSDVCDNCVVISNPNQVDSDSDGTGDYCDPDPGLRDLYLLEQHLQGEIVLNSGELSRVDVYPAGGDGQLDLSDWLVLQKRLLN